MSVFYYTDKNKKIMLHNDEKSSDCIEGEVDTGKWICYKKGGYKDKDFIDVDATWLVRTFLTV